MLGWLIGIILGKIICESSNWQHIQRLKITILGTNWQLFRLERMAKCSYFVYTKHLLICNENKEICVANSMIKQSFFPLKNKYFLGLHSEWDKSSLIQNVPSHEYTFILCLVPLPKCYALK